MPHTSDESIHFINAVRFSIEHLYKIINIASEAHRHIQIQIENIRDQEDIEDNWFVNEDQWEDDANSRYAQYLERLDFLRKKRGSLEIGIEREREIELLILRAGATRESLAIVAGSILQIAKQTLSYRFGALSSLPKTSSRQIGTQFITDIIWQGRNHALHWEENNSHPNVQEMLDKIQNDRLANIKYGENNALEILGALEWSDPQKVIDDLIILVNT
jgi:uncharacterized beta-barrel protein YwiB (DUF1934 family)